MIWQGSWVLLSPVVNDWYDGEASSQSSTVSGSARNSIMEQRPQSLSMSRAGQKIAHTKSKDQLIFPNIWLSGPLCLCPQLDLFVAQGGVNVSYNFYHQTGCTIFKSYFELNACTLKCLPWPMTLKIHNVYRIRRFSFAIKALSSWQTHLLSRQNKDIVSFNKTALEWIYKNILCQDGCNTKCSENAHWRLWYEQFMDI